MLNTYQNIDVALRVLYLIVFATQLYYLYHSFTDDHDRRKKQSTIEFITQIREKYRSLSEEILQDYGDKQISKSSLSGKSEAQVKEFLSIVEHLSVGVNTGVYDSELVNRLSGRYFLKMYSKFKPYILQTREQQVETIYEEFEEMCEKIKKHRKQQKSFRSQGNLKKS